MSSPRAGGIAKRLLVSAHGIAIALLYIVAMIVFWTNGANVRFRDPFFVSLLVPVLLIGACLALYQGNRAVHLLQLVNLACLAWTFFVGGMAITGLWL